VRVAAADGHVYDRKKISMWMLRSRRENARGGGGGGGGGGMLAAGAYTRPLLGST